MCVVYLRSSFQNMLIGFQAPKALFIKVLYGGVVMDGVH